MMRQAHLMRLELLPRVPPERFERQSDTQSPCLTHGPKKARSNISEITGRCHLLI